MVDDLTAAWIIVKAIVSSRLAQPWNLCVSTLVNMLDVVTPTIALVVFVHAFGTLGGWNTGEVLLLVGAANFCQGMSLLVAGAFDTFLFTSTYRSGQFESALLQPGNPLVFLAAAGFRPYRVGRVIASIVVIVIALYQIGPDNWELPAVLPVALIVGSVMLSFLWLIDSAAMIVLGQANDLTRNIPFISTEMAYYPQSLYPWPARLVSQLVLGLGAATYLPIAYVLGKNPNLGVWSLVAGPAVLPLIVFVVWKLWSRALARFERGDAP